ncbi:MAG TPA: CCA tRNA nucleotidyltransferase [Candidatus Limnocylindrales bacterium]|nr:CCA tRNA nucleotidyltransferase [Candidatus Limnocylindrales bacterium]
MRDGDELRIDLPRRVREVLSELSAAGAEAALVGGCVRDLARGEDPTDWDVATAAPPELVAERFPGSVWENPFGTVTVLPEGPGPGVEVTTYRVEGSYRDRRRPEQVAWSGSLADDLARRDFTINAMAWLPTDLASGSGRLLDPFGGAADFGAGLLRAVGDPDLRIAEDALRMVRAVRFVTRFDLRLDAPTEAAIRRHAHAAGGLSGERVRDELLRMLADAAPISRAISLMESLGLLQVLLPELAALRGVLQAKALPGDALDHSLRAADALSPSDPILRLAGLLHDLGKATTLANGHFIGHEEAGARLADELMVRLRLSRTDRERVSRLVRQHMFAYSPDWTDAAVRRFVRRVGVDLLDDLFALRRADNAASGVREPSRGGLEDLRRRTARAIAGDPMTPRQLAINGDDLVTELGLPPGPEVGRLLAELMEAVLDDPDLNHRDRLLQRAREEVAAG